jgi:tetratricopeptide (TPR) repeat protein
MTSRPRLFVLLCLLLSACASSKLADSPTIKTLGKHEVDIEPSNVTDGGLDKAIQSYRAYLQSVGDDRARATAMRRLADLEMTRSEAQDAQNLGKLEGAGQGEAFPAARILTPADYENAVKLYQDLLESYPNYPGNEQVLYQLAHAYEQRGDSVRALQIMDRLVTSYPDAKHIDEVQFRRGELLFVGKSYAAAEQAYAAALRLGKTSPFYDKSLYKQGWAQFKQARYQDALASFFQVLDISFTDKTTNKLVADPLNLSRGEQELMGDTLRVVSLSFSYEDGEKSITRYLQQKGWRPYAHILYAKLGELYIKQERYVDAANAFNEFVRQQSKDRHAPLLQIKAMQAYQQGGFSNLLLQAKAEFVVRYGVNSSFWASQDETARTAVMPYLKTNIEELARHYHALAQKSKQPADYRQAARWYSEFVQAFPTDAGASQMNFLLAEALFEGGRYEEAAIQYEQTAYGYAPHKYSAEAGYAALLAHDKRAQQLKGKQQADYRRRALSSAVRFAETFPKDKHAAAVLTKSAEQLFALNEFDQAARAAHQVTAMQPPPLAALRRTAWTVIAHIDFEQRAYAEAEQAYQTVLQLTPTTDVKRSQLNERLAAAVYKQGEQRRAAGDMRAAVVHFQRVKTAAPNASIVPTAEYDAAAGLLSLQQWNEATTVLERFAKQYPAHPLQRDVPQKLALAYVQSGQWSSAAAQLEKLAAGPGDAQARREALWQAAELYDKAKQKSSAANAYARYVREYPQPFERAIEARYRIAELYDNPAQAAQRHRWLTEVVDAAQHSKSHSERTRYLTASAAFQLAEPAYQAFRSVALVIPLKKSLARKKQKMQKALKAYGRAAQYDVAEFTTAATFRIAEIYHSLSRDLLASERPKGLSALELEQYGVLLEEQAYPFEEKAIEIHETNVRRVRDGIYNDWVKKSFAALGQLRPVRYAKVEKGEKISSALR